MAQLPSITIILLPIVYVYTAIGYELIECPKASNETTKSIYFLYYYGPTVDNYTRVSYEHGLAISEEKSFNKTTSTVLYLPGWGENPSNHVESVDTIAAAFIEKGVVNLIVADYYELVKSNNILLDYVSSVGNISVIGEALACFLHKCIPDVQPLNLIQLVGHSLGAQIMSRTANKYGKGVLPRLTGLDPAGPLFNIPFNEMSLSKEDAKFVVVIHTDAYCYGAGGSLGHADFFPNKGIRFQPYCDPDIADFCSHHMSWRYYAVSILYETIFPAQNCEMDAFCLAFNMRQCCRQDAPIAYMGYGVSRTAVGNFYLKTSNEYPFGLGEQGFYNAQYE
ncbi:uncharacterized protein CBL_14527 [Carabus blaptoides fortunei]